MESPRDLPEYAYVPGGPWPHPGHSTGPAPLPIIDGRWQNSAAYLFGFRLFNAGYYWEAHEVWEALWHAHGRKGPEADVLKALIKLAAAGVKVREGQVHGTRTHSERAAALFDQVHERTGPTFLGLDLAECARLGREVAELPPADAGDQGARVVRCFDFELEPR